MRLLLLWALLASFCSAQTINVESLFQPAPLAGLWKHQVGDDSRWAQPDFDDSAWSTVAMPGSVNQKFGDRWYRLHVTLPALDASQPLGLLVGPFGSAFAYEVFVDGKKIGSLGEFQATSLRLPTVGVFPLPQPSKREIVLALCVRSIPSAYTIPAETDASISYIGTLAGVRAQEKIWHGERMQGRLYGLLISAAIAMAVLFFLTLPLARAGSREYFWFGLFLAGSLGFRLIPLYPESLGLERIVTSNLGMALSLVGGVLVLPFLLIELFASRHVVLGWVGAAFMYLLACTAMASQLSDSPLSIDTQRMLILAATVTWFVYYFPFAWLNSRIRGQLPAMHAVLLFHMSGTLIQHFAVRFFALTENQGLWLQTIRLFTLLLVTFAMAALMNRRSANLASEKQRLSRELAAAAEVQALMLPGAAQAGAETEIDAVYHPASEVGGDFYQVLDRPDGTRMALVGDVSGKGLKAAMLVSVAIGALRREKSSSPAAILAGLNEALLGQGGFVTCCCIAYRQGGEVAIASAGHPAPYANGEEVAIAAGLPIGVLAEATWEETRITLPPGGQLTIVSDGVVEAENPQRELFGFERTRESSNQSAQAIADAARAWGQNDDITVVTVRRKS